MVCGVDSDMGEDLVVSLLPIFLCRLAFGPFTTFGRMLLMLQCLGYVVDAQPVFQSVVGSVSASFRCSSSLLDCSTFSDLQCWFLCSFLYY
jgi:hypothetical protein